MGILNNGWKTDLDGVLYDRSWMLAAGNTLVRYNSCTGTLKGQGWGPNKMSSQMNTCGIACCEFKMHLSSSRWELIFWCTTITLDTMCAHCISQGFNLRCRHVLVLISFLILKKGKFKLQCLCVGRNPSSPHFRTWLYNSLQRCVVFVIFASWPKLSRYSALYGFLVFEVCSWVSNSAYVCVCACVDAFVGVTFINYNLHHIIQFNRLLCSTVSCSTLNVIGFFGHNVTLPCRYDTQTHSILSFCWGRGMVPRFKCSDIIVSSLDGALLFRESRRYQLQGRVTDGDVSLTFLVPSGVMQARDPRVVQWREGQHTPGNGGR